MQQRSIGRALWMWCVLACGIAVAVAGAASAKEFATDTPSQRGADRGIYKPTVWIDPDGCEHWVMDDGAEGYMTPHRDRNGIPVCHRGDVCARMRSDQFFATNSARISPVGQQELKVFFQQTGAASYIITGHTDNRASDAYNMQLSFQRARAVAKIASVVGARVSAIRGYGERQPAASNSTAEGMAQNRRVEIICIR